jgi:hypothetical protein
VARQQWQGGRAGWLLLAALALLLETGCATPILAVDDIVQFENGDTRFVAFAEKKRGWTLSGVSDVEIQFHVDGSVVANATTDDRGFAKVVANVAEPAEQFEATATISGESFRSSGRLFAWDSQRVIVACDIDSTISETSLNALFFDDLDLTSQPIAGSVEVLQQLRRDFQILYLTARPRFTLEKTRRWLREHGYPDGPVITSLTVGDALAQTGYKTRTLGSLRKHYGNLLIGIGNTEIDAQGYGAHGMLTLLVQPKQESGHDGGVVRFQGWDQIGAFFRENRDVLRKPQTVRAAIDGDRKLAVPAVGAR